MTFNQYLLARQRAIADLLRRLAEPVAGRERVGTLTDILPFDPKTELSDQACKYLLAAGTIVRAR
jgi:hypothetical protein